MQLDFAVTSCPSIPSGDSVDILAKSEAAPAARRLVCWRHVTSAQAFMVVQPEGKYATLARTQTVSSSVRATGVQPGGGGGYGMSQAYLNRKMGLEGCCVVPKTCFMSWPRGTNPYLLMISTYPRGRDRGSYGTNMSAVSSGSRTGKARAANAISAALILSPHR